MLTFKQFVMHSGEASSWKIECDDLSDEDIAVFAYLIAERFQFGNVIGIPEGGIRIAQVLQSHRTDGHPTLIVDDVYTTGASMQRARNGMRDVIGVVLFARAPILHDWIHPVFQLWNK